ncbi:hypothetical protein [Alteribacillus sp. HJP-4]|uniref:hypothetical protein n=1 Tax=Alteribacillus sp. HJP-4 TaxID=2775394 RepID=UPI0035CD1181
MNKVWTETIFSVLLYWVFAWSFANVYYVFFSPRFEITSFIPFLLLFVLTVFWTIYTWKNKNPQVSKGKWWVTPSEFADLDEREKQITNYATKVAYTHTLLILFVSFLVFTVYSFIGHQFPFFPIYYIAFLLTWINIAYAAAWKRAYAA